MAPLEVLPPLQPTSETPQLKVFTNKPSQQQRLSVVKAGPVSTSEGSPAPSRFQVFQLRRKQQKEAGQVKTDQKNLDELKPVRAQRRLRKVAIRRRKPQNKE